MSPRQPPATPLTITTETCRQHTGFPTRPWLRALVSLNVPHARIGKRTVCRADDWLAAIDRATGSDRPAYDRAAVIARASKGAAR